MYIQSICKCSFNICLGIFWCEEFYRFFLLYRLFFAFNFFFTEPLFISNFSPGRAPCQLQGSGNINKFTDRTKTARFFGSRDVMLDTTFVTTRIVLCMYVVKWC